MRARTVGVRSRGQPTRTTMPAFVRDLIGRPMWAIVPIAVAVAACGSTAGLPSRSVAASATTASAAPTTQSARPPWGDASALKVANVSGRLYLTDAAGRALYTFDSDSTVSACNADCAVAWPPLIAPGRPPEGGSGITKAIAAGERANGSLQVTYGGAWLYYFSGDSAPGDIKGDGVGGLWHLAKP